MKLNLMFIWSLFITFFSISALKTYTSIKNILDPNDEALNKILLKVQTGQSSATKKDISAIQDMEQSVDKTIKDCETEDIQMINNTSGKLNNTINRIIYVLNETINNTVITWQNAIETRNYTILQDLLNFTNDITDQLKYFSVDAMDSLDYTIDISQVIIGEEINKKKDELLYLDTEIAQLQSFLPNVTSICGLYFTCDSCSANPECGWCSSTQQCITGDSQGPMDTICGFYTYGQCNDGGCSTIRDCKSCLNNQACGWCSNKELGYSVCIPSTSGFECPVENWYQIGSQGSACDIPRLDPFTLKAVTQHDNVGKLNPNNMTNISQVVKTWMWMSIQDKILHKVNQENNINTKIAWLQQKLQTIIELYIRAVNQTIHVEFDSPPVMILTPPGNLSNSSNATNLADSTTSTTKKNNTILIKKNQSITSKDDQIPDSQSKGLVQKKIETIDSTGINPKESMLAKEGLQDIGVESKEPAKLGKQIDMQVASLLSRMSRQYNNKKEII